MVENLKTKDLPICATIDVDEPSALQRNTIQVGHLLFFLSLCCISWRVSVCAFYTL